MIVLKNMKQRKFRQGILILYYLYQNVCVKLKMLPYFYSILFI